MPEFEEKVFRLLLVIIYINLFMNNLIFKLNLNELIKIRDLILYLMNQN